MTPVNQTIDPALQAVFDALDAYMAGTTWVNGSAGINFDGSGVTHSMNCSDRGNENSFTYTTRGVGKRVTLAPTSMSLGPGETQQFTATAVDADGVDIPGATFLWSLSGTPLGSVDSTGLYTAPAAIEAATSDTVTAALVGEPAWSSVSIPLHP